jgi:UDP-glucose 4-epimerase
VRRALITGGAGFIGSTLADRLLARGIEVAILDDFRTGRREFIDDALATGGAELFEGDILDTALLDRATAGCDAVFHLQANADVRHGLANPQRDLEQNTVATSRVLEAMRRHDVKLIAFSSTGSVYGEPDVFPTPEDAPFPTQTSLYAASKLAGEGMIGAYCHGLGFTGVVYRFVSVLGERYTHGHVIDFYRALKRDPTRLRILGDGRQEKSYLYVQDCVTAMQTAIEHHADQEGLFVYNLGTDETVTVEQSVATIAERMGVSPGIERTGGIRGWPGDSPLIHLDTSRLRALGWHPELSIRDAIARTLDWFEREPHLIDADQEATAP